MTVTSTGGRQTVILDAVSGVFSDQASVDMGPDSLRVAINLDGSGRSAAQTSELNAVFRI